MSLGKTKVRWPYDEYVARRSVIGAVSSLVASFKDQEVPPPQKPIFPIAAPDSDAENSFINASEILTAAIEVYEFYSRRYINLLKKVEYKTYLESPHWHAVRLRAREDAKERCQVCNGGPPLNVHHRTYVRRGEEQPEDVTVLCSKCHSDFHERGELEPEPKD